MRKITFSILIFMTICAYGDGRQRSVGTGINEAALAPKVVPGTTVSGTVTAVNGNILSLANGLVTVDATAAKITDDHGATGSIASITPGTTVFAVLSSSTFAAGAPLPASVIAVHRVAQVALSGPVETVGTSSLTLLGRTITVDANTSFGGHTRGLSDILPNDIAVVEANAVGGVLVATSVMTIPPMPKSPTLIHGTVKSIGTDTWVITDNAAKDWTIVVNAQTKIIGTPKVGDSVEILVNTDNANQYVAVSIMKSPIVMPQMKLTGVVKSIMPSGVTCPVPPATCTISFWTVSSPRASEVRVEVTNTTTITGDPKVGDTVDVLADIVGPDRVVAVSITKSSVVVTPKIVITGTVKSTGLLEWVITDSRSGTDVSVSVNAKTTITGNPAVNDAVMVTANIDGNGHYTAVSIIKLGIVPPQMKISGVVKAIEVNAPPCPAPPTACTYAYWTIGPAVGLGPDVRVEVTTMTKIVGDPKVGDHVDVLLAMSTGHIVAVEITKR